MIGQEEGRWSGKVLGGGGRIIGGGGGKRMERSPWLGETASYMGSHGWEQSSVVVHLPNLGV